VRRHSTVFRPSGHRPACLAASVVSLKGLTAAHEATERQYAATVDKVGEVSQFFDSSRAARESCSSTGVCEESLLGVNAVQWIRWRSTGSTWTSWRQR
jgi:hypothetical protein